MKIAIFDSGLGGLTVASEVFKALPSYDYLYLGDNTRAPYGIRSQQEIYNFTRQGIKWLFARGAKMCILACNTASSQALRKLQQDWLPKEFPDRKILGVIIPIAQEVSRTSQGLVGVIGTPATVLSKAYIRELRKIKPDIKIIQVAAPELVPLIEKGASEEEIRKILEAYLSPFLQASIDTLILGSTHYSLIESSFRQLLGGSIVIPHTAKIVAVSLGAYLSRHREIEEVLTRGRGRAFYTTGDPEMVKRGSERFLGEAIEPDHVEIERLV